MPAVTGFCRYFRVTRLAQAHKIALLMRSALWQRNNVVNLLCRGQSAIPFTNLTQWMLCYVSVTDSFPRSSVPFLHFRQSVIFFVAFILLLLMFLAEPSVCQFRTARIGTRSFRFLRHLYSPRLGHNKSPASFTLQGLVRLFFFYILHYTICWNYHQLSFLSIYYHLSEFL